MLNIITINDKKWVSAIEIHKGLFNNRRYSNFVSDYLTNYYLIKEGEEFVTGQLQTSGKKGGRPVREYLIHLDYAKEICATIRTPQARSYIKYLISLENKVQDGDLFTHEQILYMVKLKSVFQYIENCAKATEKHLKTFVEDNGKDNKYIYADFHNMRNAALKIDPNTINKRIQEWCIDNHKASLKSNMSKTDKIILMDKYENLRNAIWDFLKSERYELADKVADLVKAMAKAENLEIYRKNEDNLFRSKEELPNISQVQLI